MTTPTGAGRSTPARKAARLLLAGSVLVVSLLAGCGIRPTGVITGGPAPVVTSPENLGQSRPGRVVPLYLVSNGRPMLAPRKAGPLRPDEVLELLAAGPNPDERNRGYTSEVPRRISPIAVALDRTDPVKLGTVELGTDVTALTATAADQITCTFLATLSVEGRSVVAGARVVLVGKGRHRGPLTCPFPVE